MPVRDGQRARSIRSLSMYACDAPVHELSEIKARPELWRRVFTTSLMPRQKEVKAKFEPPLHATCLKVCCQHFSPHTGHKTECIQGAESTRRQVRTQSAC